MKKELTKREREILELVAWGNSQKEIAYELDLKKWTVDTHLKNIKLKTGLQKATELEAAWFMKHYRIPVIDIPERFRARIAAAMMLLSVFTVVFQTTDMLRIINGNGRVGARTISLRAGGRRARRDKDYILKTA